MPVIRKLQRSMEFNPYTNFHSFFFLDCSHLIVFLSYNEEPKKLQVYVQAQVNFKKQKLIEMDLFLTKRNYRGIWFVKTKSLVIRDCVTRSYISLQPQTLPSFPSLLVTYYLTFVYSFSILLSLHCLQLKSSN